jgi:hypothetical protein
VRQGVTDKRQPLEDDEGADDSGHYADDYGGEQGPLHELEGPGLGEEIDHR